MYFTVANSGAFSQGNDAPAGDVVARVFGCPDKIGMAKLSKASPTRFKLCYHLKRPTGKVALAGLIGLGVYLVMRG